jgi:hypothetical protein
LLAAREKAPRRPRPLLEREAATWLAAADTAPLTAAQALESLAWCGALPHLAADVDDQIWWRLLNHLVACACEPGEAPEDPLAGQLLFGELPLALAYSFGELSRCRALAEQGRRKIEEGYAKMLDPRGVPLARFLPWLRPLLASWTRSQVLSNPLSARRRGIDRRYRGLAGAALRLSRPDGRAVLSQGGETAWDADFLKAVKKLGGQKTTRLWRLTTKGRATRGNSQGNPSAAFESELAALAMLRTDWTPDSPRLAVTYPGQQVRLELNVGQRTFWSGAWKLDLTLDGAALEPKGDWEQVCWVSDAAVDYLELAIELTCEVTVERHILLARQDRVLLLADTVTSARTGAIEYRGRLPLCGWSSFVGESETRDGTLVIDRRPVARVLPLALPEWRVARSPGEVDQREESLELKQSAQAMRLFAPLFFDLDRRRLRQPSTWRQLTVAENRENVATDVAVGYRAQVGQLQWLAYRSLAPPAVRSVLGKSLMHQFLFGKFPQTGVVETLLEIDST